MKYVFGASRRQSASIGISRRQPASIDVSACRRRMNVAERERVREERETAAREEEGSMEGPLSKWTNVMQGWQYRWFVLDDNNGVLSYYTVCMCMCEILLLINERELVKKLV